MELLTFKKFNDPVLAKNMAGILNDSGIKYVLEESAMMFDRSFSPRSEASREYLLKIDSADFNKATQVLNDYESQFTNDVEADYYLFGFTSTELLEVIAKPDEWSAFDYALAKKILYDGGIPIDDTAEKLYNEKRLAELKKPEASQTTWVVFGYLFAIAGGVLGFFIGWSLWTSKKTLPNGEQVYNHTDSDRRHGKLICYLSIIGLMAGIYYKFRYVN